MKILIDCRCLQTYSAYRGIGRYTRQLIRVCRDDPRCFFLFFDEKNREAMLPRELTIRSPRRLITFSDRILLKKLIGKTDMNIFHSTAFGLPSKPGGKKFILTVHDLSPIKYPQYSSWRHRYIFKKIIASACHADLVLTDSGNTARDLLDYLSLNPDRVRVVHNALDDRINPDRACKPEMRLPSEFMLYAGGCDPIKNVETIVRAAGLVGIPLVIAGQVSHKRQKELLSIPGSRNPDLIQFTGFVSDRELSFLYRQACLFLFPSFNEGFGYPPLEAIQCGTPAVVSRTGALLEVLGDAAVYVDQLTDPMAFAEAIKEVNADSELRSALLRRGNAILKKYSLENFAGRIKNIYSRLSEE